MAAVRAVLKFVIMAHQVQRSRLRRALGLSRLGARVALDQGRRLLVRDETALHREIATALVKELGQLKGLPMKIGQILSYMEGVVPAEYRDVYREVLAELRTHSAPMSADAWRGVFVEDFGKPPEEAFDSFDPEPIAAASIGQVHRALLRGVPVCVKIQYPGIGDAVESDLKNLDAAIHIMRAIAPNVDTRQMIEDFRVRLAEECDYHKEAEYQRRFAAIYAGDPDLVVPDVFEDLCSRRVLTTRLIRGVSLDEFVDEASQTERNRAGATLFRFAFGTLLNHRLFHADPHPGNLLFRSGGGHRLGVLDYGCVQPIDRAARDDMAALMRDALDGRDLTEPAARALGITEIDDATRAAVADIVRQMLAPILEKQPFRFTRQFATDIGVTVVEAKKSLAARFLTRRGRFVADREGVMFVVRNLFGLASIWGSLEAEGDYRALMERMLEGRDDTALAPSLGAI